MTDIRLIWCHGSLSQPWGDKSKALADIAKGHGLTMDAVDFQDLENPDERVQRLVGKLNETTHPAILVGSSMGGYVASAAAKQADVLGLFLLAPAFYFPGYDVHVFSGLPQAISVVHGWDDDVVPVENSIRFAKLHKADLHILPDGHRLSESLGAIGSLFNHFLTTVSQG
ncbi:alpha/beta fold hydrolase [Pseudodesulfovibrio sp.]|nr:alpha/beta fold hydrolase [Pseudodesulfovibrio sp.]